MNALCSPSLLPADGVGRWRSPRRRLGRLGHCLPILLLSVLPVVVQATTLASEKEDPNLEEFEEVHYILKVPKGWRKITNSGHRPEVFADRNWRDRVTVTYAVYRREQATNPLDLLIRIARHRFEFEMRRLRKGDPFNHTEPEITGDFAQCTFYGKDSRQNRFFTGIIILRNSKAVTFYVETFGKDEDFHYNVAKSIITNIKVK